jgi:hypothetical protein
MELVEGQSSCRIIGSASSTGRGPAGVHVTVLLNFFDELKRRIP